MLTFPLSLAQWSVSSWDASFREGTSSFAQRDMSFLRMKNQQIHLSLTGDTFHSLILNFQARKVSFKHPSLVCVCVFSHFIINEKKFLLRATFLEVFFFARIPQLVASQLVQKN